jgi:outer membrane protein TolC
MLVLLGAMLPATLNDQALAASNPAKKNATPAPAPTKRAPSVATYHLQEQRIHQLNGEITLDRAVQVALQQNPAIMAAIQQIQITRGQIIEVRAAALPQITLTGAYAEQDQRLLHGGGGGVGGGVANPLSATNVSNSSVNSTVPMVSSTTASAASQPSTPVGTIGSGTAPSAGGGTTTTTTGTGGAATAAVTGATGGATIAAASVMRARAVTTDPVTTTTTTAGGATSTNATNQSVNVGELIKELENDNSSNRSNNILQNKSWNVTVEATQLLYAGGQVAAALRIAKFTQDSAYYQLRDSIDTIVSTVRTQFYAVLLNRALILVQQESVRLLEQQLQDQRNRFEAGTVPRFNVLQAEVALSNQRPALISAQNNYLVAMVQLAKTLNVDPGPTGKPTFVCIGELGIRPQRLSLKDALDLAHARRPFLKVQRLSILSSAEDIKVQLAGYKPTLSADAGYELRNNSNNTDISQTVNGWFFGVNGSWAIFDGFATYGRVKQARARLEQSKLNYDDSVHEVDLEVQTSYANIEQARETIASQQENVKEALEAVRLAQERLNAGAGTQLDVLNAQVQLTTARTTEIQARANYNIALAQFDLATATDTVYPEYFKDPLAKLERSIFGRLAATGLPPVPPVAPVPPIEPLIGNDKTR